MDELIAAALSRATAPGHTVEDVKAAIAAGDAQLWRGARTLAVTEILRSPRLKVLNIWLVAGRLDEFLAMLPAIEAWGRAQGCGRSMGTGRASWGAAIRSHGYAATHTVFEKEL